jgi:glycosyltransferase involved in cell wall biosynthesis
MSELKKIVIITYFFPPCNLTASQRSLGWAKYFHEFGYYPIIITRNWDHPIKGPDDMHFDSGTELKISKGDGYEIHYLPFKGNLRDRLYARYGKSKFNFIRKVLSFIELIGVHYFTRMIPFSNIYFYALNYLKEQRDIKQLIISGNPFELFRFGYLLKHHLGVSWIADYRDDWTTSEVNHSRGLADSFIRMLERGSERKWVGSATSITTISSYYAKKISAEVKRPGKVILNGFFAEDYQHLEKQVYYSEFTIVYNGMLYPSQEIELFTEAFKRFADKNESNRTRIKLRFPGILFLKHVAQRVKELLEGYEDMVIMTERISRDEVLEIQSKAHLLLMVAHRNTYGIPSSKIYEYMAIGKPVLICPGDHDILHETFTGYNLGMVAYSSQEAETFLQNKFNIYQAGNYTSLEANPEYVNKFNRKHQTKELAKLLDDMNLGKD